MGKRKLRFTPCKNYERKKYAKFALVVSVPILYWSRRSATSPPSTSSSLSLQVKIPINLYLELSLSDPRAVIAKFINVKNSLSSAVEWNVGTQVNMSGISTGANCAYTIASISKLFPFGTVRIEISSDSNWNHQVASRSRQVTINCRSTDITQQI